MGSTLIARNILTRNIRFEPETTTWPSGDGRRTHSVGVWSGRLIASEANRKTNKYKCTAETVVIDIQLVHLVSPTTLPPLLQYVDDVCIILNCIGFFQKIQNTTCM